MPGLTLRCQFVLKKRDVTESRYGQTISSRSFSRVLEQVNDQEIRDGKSVHTVRDSCYHKEKGAEKTCGGKAGMGVTTNTSKVR